MYYIYLLYILIQLLFYIMQFRKVHSKGTAFANGLLLGPPIKNGMNAKYFYLLLTNCNHLLDLPIIFHHETLLHAVEGCECQRF